MQRTLDWTSKGKKKIDNKKYKEFKKVAENLSIKLNNFITSTYKAKNNKPQ